MTTETLNPIPLDFIVSHALAQSTEARRLPFVELTQQWAKSEGKPHLATPYIERMTGRQTVCPGHMPKEFTPKFRQGERAEKLLEIIRRIDEKISSGEELWTWAHVYRVMIDEGILFSVNISPNMFDSIICSIVPGKGRDTVRKNGDYTTMRKQKEGWSFWPKNNHIDPLMASHRTICMMIAQEFEPVLDRKILLDY